MNDETTVFLVIREGIYRYEILGIYPNYCAAFDRREAVLATEDGYHSLVIAKAVLGADMSDVEDVDEKRAQGACRGVEGRST